MPTYQYACSNCGHKFDVVQSFSDDALTTCDKCQGQLRKVYGQVGVVFKGSGFYATDSRKKPSSSSSTSSSRDTSSSSSTQSSSASKSDSTSTSNPTKSD